MRGFGVLVASLLLAVFLLGAPKVYAASTGTVSVTVRVRPPAPKPDNHRAISAALASLLLTMCQANAYVSNVLANCLVMPTNKISFTGAGSINWAGSL